MKEGLIWKFNFNNALLLTFISIFWKEFGIISYKEIKFKSLLHETPFYFKRNITPLLWVKNIFDESITLLDANEKRLYYMAPDSPFLDEPEKLKNYRQRLIKQVSTIPQPEPILLMAHELQKVTFHILHFYSKQLWTWKTDRSQRKQKKTWLITTKEERTNSNIKNIEFYIVGLIMHL